MEEAVLEQVEKDREDEQWDKYHEEKAETKSGNGEPSQKQKTYIIALAKAVGLKMDVSKIGDRQQASVLIERLKTLSRQMNGNGNANGYELRDKRVAFGMSTKLIFKKYLDRHKEVRRSKKFWQEVEEFYREYQQQQESAIHSPFTADLEQVRK